MGDRIERVFENPERMGVQGLAFLGDAVYELMMRERVLAAGERPSGALHDEAVRYARARSQSAAYAALEPLLTERELSVLKRGRNAHTAHSPKSSSPLEYRRATAVETLFGYLYLKGEQARLVELCDVCAEAIRCATEQEEG